MEYENRNNYRNMQIKILQTIIENSGKCEQGTDCDICPLARKHDHGVGINSCLHHVVGDLPNPGYTPDDEWMNELYLAAAIQELAVLEIDRMLDTEEPDEERRD